MKKILCAIPFFIAFILSSCGPDKEDYIFGESAADRMDKTLTEYMDVLTSAPNGWKMSYYAGEPEVRTLGEYTFLVSFDKDKKVTMATESAINGLEMGEKSSSFYDLIADQGPVLTFNTYNEILHFFTEPSSSVGYNGYKGDFDFVIREVTKEKIILEGRKYHQEIVLTPFDAGATWDTYLEELGNNIKRVTEYQVYDVIYKGKQVDRIDFDPIYRDFDFENALVYTHFSNEGFTLSEAVEIEGTQAKSFIWNAQKELFECVENKDIALKGFVIPYEYFVGNFTLSADSKLYNVALVEKTKGVDYTLKGLPFAITVNYSKKYNGITISPQYLGKYQGEDVDLFMVSDGGNITNASGSGLIGVEGANKNIYFSDNGFWGLATGLHFRTAPTEKNLGVLWGPLVLIRK